MWEKNGRRKKNRHRDGGEKPVVALPGGVGVTVGGGGGPAADWL